jgi:integrase
MTNDITSTSGPGLEAGKTLQADRHPAAVYLAGLSAGSLPAQRSALLQIAGLFGKNLESMNWGGLRYQHAQWARARLAERYAPATANRLLTALRQVMRAAWRLDYLSEGEYSKLADVKRISGSGDDTDEGLTGREITIGELTAIMGACADDESLSGARDAAVIALGYGLGLRRAEVANARMSDYSADKGTFTVKFGKGGKTRVLPIDDGAKDALESWLKVRGDVLSLPKDGFIFVGVNKGGHVSSKRISARGVHELFEKRVEQAGVKACGFHDLRRSFITHLLGLGVDVALVAKLAGHANTSTTLRYDKRGMQARRAGIKVLHVPFRERR